MNIVLIAINKTVGKVLAQLACKQAACWHRLSGFVHVAPDESGIASADVQA